jgi:pyruvate/2-oxoglutarate dehydrogenase complex dihydrolipoamide acyltransferase (E2) component
VDRAPSDRAQHRRRRKKIFPFVKMNSEIPTKREWKMENENEIPSPSSIFHLPSSLLNMPSIPIIMPQLGESIAEANIINFLVKPGDTVEADQDLIEVETNKANMNVTSPCRGRIEKFTAQLNESYAVGAVLGQIEATQEEACVGPGCSRAGENRRHRPHFRAGRERRQESRSTDRARFARAGERGGRELPFAAAQGAHERTRFARRRSRGRGRQRRGGPGDR